MICPKNDRLPAKTRGAKAHRYSSPFSPVNIIPSDTNPQTESRFTLAI
jgi:hypothetical protein